MNSQKKFVVSHAPFWHNGSWVAQRQYHTIFAALPAVLAGVIIYGVPALAAVCLSVATAIAWEWLYNLVTKKQDTIGDGNAALIGLIFGMLLPATAPWWLVLTGTFFAILIGKQIFGGIGANPFNPAVLAYAILRLSWWAYFDFDAQYVNYHFDFFSEHPLGALKAFGPEAVADVSLVNLFLGREVGGIGATSDLALIAGGLYLILRGYVRWEIPLAFIAGLFLTAALFNLVDPSRFAGPAFHLLSGYSMIGAFFLATEDSSSPVNALAMVVYGAAGGVMTMLIRNIGVYADGVIYAILVINLISPLLDKIRPKALGKVA